MDIVQHSYHARIQKIFSGGGGGGGVQTPGRGLTEYFNMAKINNLAIPGGFPLDPPMHMTNKHIFICLKSAVDKQMQISSKSNGSFFAKDRLGCENI